MSKEKKYVLYGLIVILIAALGTTLAYFVANIVGDRKPISVNATNLKITFNKGDDGSIEATDIEPGSLDITKTFSITNETDTDYSYNLIFKDYINTFKTTGFLIYKVTSTDGGYNMTDFADMPKLYSTGKTVIKYSINLPANSTHNYTIQIKYLSSDTIDQSDDMEKEVTGKIYAEEGTKNPNIISLKEAMLRDNTTIKERTDFSVTNTENTTGTIYKTNKTEDGSDVYYYSGNTTKNWVKFGGFYWRIIRTNEDESVRILYSGTSHDTTSGYIGTSAYNSVNTGPMYVGYMYGTSGSLENNRTNTNDSTIKTTIDTWYENNLLTNYNKYISKTTIYCNDRSTETEDNSYSIYNPFNYGAYTRLYTNKTPSYKCGANTSNGLFEETQAVEDKFSASTTGGGNGQLKYPIALMTADEISFAGGKIWTALSSPYAWYYTNSASGSITGTSYWWLLSPCHFGTANSALSSIRGSDNFGYIEAIGVDNSAAIRPVISLSSCVKVSGIGTPEDPYVIDENSCS